MGEPGAERVCARLPRAPGIVDAQDDGRPGHGLSCLRGRRPIIRLMLRTTSRSTGVLDAKRLTRIFHNSAADRSVIPFGLSKRPIPIFDRSSSCRVLGCTTLPWISREPESLSRVDFVAAQSVVVSARSLHTAGRSKRWTIHDWPRYSQQPRRWLHRLDRRSRGV